ncbi:related to RTM1 protein [Ramularia collo-cygni]|uniref:Related to RTM1 protein n=1 Tax=Ramularia collo-cygni TaxID=112498 RepID=A0A2D3VKT3_9PEZI|nr:related to RTM1 protein [Ramularia collo-cygni]CZT21713.1 related to RTM1 protein [Ramularia collo-cygni]
MQTSKDGKQWSMSYQPSHAAAIVFIACFGVGTIIHFAQMVWLRSWYFIPFLIGCMMETFGYYGRFWLSQEPGNFKAYVLYDLLVLPAPIFLAATLYMSLSRIIQILDADELSPIRPKLMSKLFVIFDVLCFLVQISGIGMGVTTSLNIQRIGGKVVIIGLVLQILVFVVFIWMAVLFLQRCKAQSGSNTLRWKRYIGTLLVASGCIMVRNIVRGIEHAQGSDGTVTSKEVFIYMFDALPIFATVFLFAVFQPGRLQRAVRGFNASTYVEDDIGMKQESQMEDLVAKYTPAKSKYGRPYEQPAIYSR